MNHKPYEIKILPLHEYLAYQFKTFGAKHMLGLTNEGSGYRYPRILATAYCDTVRREIVMCKGLVNEKTLYHELGHELGFDHVPNKPDVMYPLITRGTLGIPEIDEAYYLKYGYSKWAEMIMLKMRLK